MSIVAVHGPTMLGQGGGGPGGGVPGDGDPGITSLSPSTLPVTAAATLITITGNDFEAGSVVEIAQQARPTTFVNSTTLTVSYDPLVAGTVNFTVRNTNGEESNSFPFIISGGVIGDGDPEISGISPSTLPASAGATTLTITGTDFDAGSVIEVGAVAHPTTYVSATSLTTSYDPTTPGTVFVTVRNPNAEESNSFPFIVTAAGTQAYDPNEHTIDDIKAYVEALTGSEDEIHDEIQRLLDLEREGQARVTLIAWLETRPGMYHPNDHTVAEVKEYIEALVGTEDWITEETQRILDLERSTQNRTRLVAWLDARLGVS